MTAEIRVPTLGESVTEATVGTWFKKSGDQVKADEMVCELETDKVSVEVPSPVAGVLGEIVAPTGQVVEPGALLALVEEGQTGATPERTKPKPKIAAAPAVPEKDDRVDVRVPTLGESVTEATVVEWRKSVGESVSADEMICELETDKVAVEVPAPAQGVLVEILAEKGATVAVNETLAVISTSATASPKPVESVATTEMAASKPARDVEDAPSAKKLMTEHGFARNQVEGTGRDDRVMKEDVLRAIAEAERMSEMPASPTAGEPTGDAVEERVPMSRLRQTIARRLKDAQNTAAMLTTYNEVDMSGIMAIRSEYKDVFAQKYGVKLGFMSFFVKACCSALIEVPEVNAEIDGTDIVYKKFVHMSIAVGTPTGLVVPVVRNADAMRFADIEQRIAELGTRARDGKLSLAEMQGGTFTISNGGVYGSLLSSPILNPPQAGILGMHKIQERPVVVGGEIGIRPMMYLALSYDHRIVDGKGAVTFLVRVKEAIEDPRRLLMGI